MEIAIKRAEEELQAKCFISQKLAYGLKCILGAVNSSGARPSKDRSPAAKSQHEDLQRGHKNRLNRS